MSAIPDRAEEMLLGGLFSASATGAGSDALSRARATGLDSAHFWRPSHAALYRVLVDLDERGVDLSPLSVAAELDQLDDDRLAQLGVDRAHLLGLVDTLAHEPGAYIASVGRYAELIRHRTAARSGLAFERLTARETVELPEPANVELCGPIVVRGHRTIVLGATGHGKSSVSMQIVRAATTGDPFLEWQGAGGIRALVIDLEQGLRSIKRALRDAGLAASDAVDIVRVPDGLSLNANADELHDLEQVIVDSSASLVLLDPYYKAHRADSNEERAIVDLFRVLDGLRARHGFALILPAHPRKEAPGRDGPRKLGLDDVFGSGAVTRGAEIVIAIERLSHGYGRLRFLKDRDSDLPVGDAWPLIFTRGEGFTLDPKEAADETELEQRIRADVDAGALRTVKEWAATLSIREGRAKRLLVSIAEADGLQVVVGPPGRKANAVCYGAAPDAREQQGAVTQLLLDEATAPLLPASLREKQELGAADECAGAPGAADLERELGERLDASLVDPADEAQLSTPRHLPAETEADA